jgi:adenylosuccinate synthase
LRLGDIFNPESFAENLKEVMEYHNFTLVNYYGVDAIDYDTVLAESLVWAEELKPMVLDITNKLHAAREAGESILFEGAQGSLLDIDHGTYPYVTSSNTTAGGVATGSGMGPMYIDYVLGITKAYTTRVGSGPFPTELSCDVGQHLGVKGHEFGATTGRERRCGWFDAVAVKHAIRINSISGLCLTKLDVLDGLESLNICTAYKNAKGDIISVPFDSAGWDNIVPVYETMPGWTESTFGAQSMDDLPANAIAYIRRLEALVGAPADIVSTGPDRVETIVLRHPFDA